MFTYKIKFPNKSDYKGLKGILHFKIGSTLFPGKAKVNDSNWPFLLKVK